MAEAADTSLGVARDIVIAMISRQNGYLGTGKHDEAAQQVAEVYSIIYDMVRKKQRGG